MKKIYLRTPEFTDKEGTYARVFIPDFTENEGPYARILPPNFKSFSVNNKPTGLLGSSTVLKLFNERVELSHEYESLDFKLPLMSASVLAWVWTVQPKYRPGDTIKGFVVTRERLNPYIMALRKSQTSGMIRLISKDSKEIIKVVPLNFSKMVSELNLETSEYLKTGTFAVEITDQHGKVLGSTEIEITRFEKKELMIHVNVPRWILLGDDAKIAVKGQYYHGASVEEGVVILEYPSRTPINQLMENGDVTITLKDLTEGVHNFSLRLEDEQGRSDTRDCQIRVSTQSAHLKIILPEENKFSRLPFNIRVKLETPDGLSISNFPVEVKWRHVGKLQTRDLVDKSRVLPTDINGYIEFAETLPHEGFYDLQINAVYNDEIISAVESIRVERMVEGLLFIENKLDKSVFSEGEKVTGKIRIFGNPETVKRVKYGYLDLISDRIVETKLIEIKNPEEIVYEFEGIVNFYGPVSVEFYVNNTIQKLSIINRDKLDKSGCLMAKSTTLIELSTPLEVKLNIDAPESSHTGSSIKISVDIDSALLTEDFKIFGALIDERILTSHQVSNINTTFLTAPSALEVIIKESQQRFPYRESDLMLGGPMRGGLRPSLLGELGELFKNRESAGGDTYGIPEIPEIPRNVGGDRISVRERARIIEKIRSVKQSMTETESIIPPELILRTNFAESVLLHPIQIKNGKGTFNVTVPDTVTTFRIVIFGVGTTQFGQKSRPIIVRNPVFTQILNSAEMVLKDQLDIRCIVQNTTDKPISGAKLHLRTLKNLSLIEDMNYKIIDQVPAQSASVIPWRVIGSEVGQADIELELATSNFTEISRLDQPLYIKPPGEPVIQRFQAYVDALTPLNLTWTLDGDEAFALGVVNCLPAMELAVIEGLESLAHYPYGCCEQTSAAIIPNIVVYEYLAAADKLSEEMKAKLVNNMEGGLNRYLTVFRGPSGGFGLWNGNNTSVFHTGLVLSVIGRMKNYVKDIPDDLFSSALDYLTKHKNDTHWKAEKSLQTPFPSTLNNPAITAYILNSLALGNIEDKEAFKWMNDHYSNYQDDPTTSALLLEAWARINSYKESFPNLGSRIRTQLLEMATNKDDQVFWAKGSSLTSEIESTAYVLISLAIAFPNDASLYDIYQKGIDYLMARRQTNGWRSTRDTLYASMAVAKVATSDKPDFTLKLYLNDELRAKETVTPENMAWKIYDLRNIYLDNLQTGKNTVKLTLEGSGKCHCVCEIRKWYFDLKEQSKPLPISVKRHISATNVKLDEIITIDIECEPEGLLEAILIEQPIPALLEFSDDALKTLENELEHIEINNNKIAIFFSRLESKTKISLPFKVAFTGECRIEPLQVYGMYEPDRRIEVLPVQLKSQ